LKHFSKAAAKCEKNEEVQVLSECTLFITIIITTIIFVLVLEKIAHNFYWGKCDKSDIAKNVTEIKYMK